MPTYRIVTLGCKLNQADSASLEARLRSLGLRRVDAGDPPDGSPEGGTADLVILNTCTVTHNADREARQIARRLRRGNPRATLIATGCYAERDPRALEALQVVDHVVGMKDQAARVTMLAAKALGLPYDPEHHDLGAHGATDACEPLAGGVLDGDRTRAYLKVQDGCGLRCSYCIIPSVRGASRSVPPDEVLRRISLLVEAGYREIVFTGVNTGDYGRDLEPSRPLHRLLQSAVGLPGLGRLRLNSLEPRTVTAGVVGALRDSGGRLAPHLQVPLQSGCDTTLARMRRPYRTADYARIVSGLRAAIPGIGLGADVIAGFPGETDAEFEATVRFIADSPLNYLHVFSYSARPGTAAASLPGQVPAALVRERSARLRALGRELSRRFRLSFAGRRLEVLTLREVRPDGRLRALSGNFIDLGLDTAGRPPGDLFNRLLTVRVTEVTADDTHAILDEPAPGERPAPLSAGACR